METKVNFAAVGAFVIVLTVAIIAGTLWLSSGKAYRKVYDPYETYVTESVSGLNVNSAVRYRGVDVGRVRSIALAAGNVEQVRVALDIERGTPIKVDTVATLVTQGLTGIATIELSGGRNGSPMLQASPGQPVPVIASAPSVMGRLETAAPILIANLARVTERLDAVLDEDNRRALRAVLADLAVLTRTLAARSTTIDTTLAHAARTMDNAARLSAALPQTVQRFEHAAAALERMADEVSSASAKTRGTLDAARDALDSARSTIDGSRGDVAQFTGTTLPEAHALVTELRALTATMRRVADEVERNPAVLLQGRHLARRGPGE